MRRRRDDGYHELETLFAFVDAGDTLVAHSSAQDQLQVVGEFAAKLSDPFANIAAKALGLLRRSDGLAITLEKNLPVAAGLGGGSADAGAVFRMIRDAYGLPDDWAQRAARLGADVPACVESLTCIGRGTGAELESITNDLAGTPVLLVNPRVPLSTASVFAGWDGKDCGPMPQGSPSLIARDGRNDLEGPATALVPQIRTVLAELRGRGAMLARMSGSGATCFALFENQAALASAAASLARHRPEWWQMLGKLR